MVDDDSVATVEQHPLCSVDDGPEVLEARSGVARRGHTRLRPVDDHRVAVHALDDDTGSPDPDADTRAGALVVVAGSDQDPVTPVRRVHGSLDRSVRIAKALPAADAKHRRGATSSGCDPATEDCVAMTNAAVSGTASANRSRPQSDPRRVALIKRERPCPDRAPR